MTINIIGLHILPWGDYTTTVTCGPMCTIGLTNIFLYLQCTHTCLTSLYVYVTDNICVIVIYVVFHLRPVCDLAYLRRPS